MPVFSCRGSAAAASSTRPSPARRTPVSLAHRRPINPGDVVAMDPVDGGEKQLEKCIVCNALGMGPFQVLGALVAIPVCIKRNYFAPLACYGSTGTILDIIRNLSWCEREHEKQERKLLEAQKLTANTAFGNESSESFGNLDK